MGCTSVLKGHIEILDLSRCSELGWKKWKCPVVQYLFYFLDTVIYTISFKAGNQRKKASMCWLLWIWLCKIIDKSQLFLLRRWRESSIFLKLKVYYYILDQHIGYMEAWKVSEVWRVLVNRKTNKIYAI